MDFTHLHVHSHYSLLDGLPKIDELIKDVKEKGMDSVALTDHGVMYGAVEFFKKAKAAGVKPIIGCEVYLAYEGMDQKRPNVDNKRYHLVLLAKNRKGYQNLVKLVSKAHLEGFYYKPRIDEDLLKEHSEGLIGLTACIQGKIPQLIIANKKEQAKETIKKYKNIFADGDFYLEIQDHPEIKEQKKVNKRLKKYAKEFDLPLVATCDVHYLKKEDAEAQDILMRINTGTTAKDSERLSMKESDFSLRPPKEMEEAIKNTPEAIEKCEFEFDLGDLQLPKFKVPNGKSAEDYLKDLTYKGAKERYGKITEEIDERLTRELNLINDNGFSTYFLIVQDFINWAKDNDIVVGPGRGSAAGSLVSYCLNITTVDPLKYNLIFERFMNGERISPPDIDIDFTDKRRDEVIEYVAQKYGEDKVAQIITFGTMAARGSIRDVGRALGYSYNYCDKIAKMIPFGNDLKETLKKISEFKKIYENEEKAKILIDYALKLEGCARHASTHACGIVISPTPLNNIIPTQNPSQNEDHIITQYEMHAVEDLGLLKMDFLGLKNLTIIEETINKIEENIGDKIKIEDIPLEDQKTFELFQKANTTGVFQLESQGMKSYLKQLKPTKFEDIIAMVALYRPGPMELIPKYIRRKHGKEEVDYIHPQLKPILKSTYGILVYQEQVMKIAQELAGFSLGEADVLRKAIGKKIRKLLMDQKEKFINGMINNNIDKDIALQIWNWIEPFAEYSFNRSHAASYGTIAYQTAYLKAHYPVEFMAALLASKKNDVDKIAKLIKECKSMDIEILPPEINESFRDFTVVKGDKDKKIRFGLTAIKNVGKSAVESIIKARKKEGKFKNIEDFVAKMDTGHLNKKTMESLIKAGTFDKFAERNKLLFNLEKLLEWAREKEKMNNEGQKGLFDGLSEEKQKGIHKLKLENAEEATRKEKLNWEKELLGLFISSHPLNSFEGFLKKKALPISKIIKGEKFTEEYVRVGGLIASTKKITTKKGRPMMFLNLEDLEDTIEVVVFPSVYKQNSSKLEENKVVLISGKTQKRNGGSKIICEKIDEIKEA